MDFDVVSKISNYLQLLALVVLSIVQIVEFAKPSNLILSIFAILALTFLGYIIIIGNDKTRVTRYALFLNAQLELLYELRRDNKSEAEEASNRTIRQVYEQVVHGLDIRIGQMRMALRNISKSVK